MYFVDVDISKYKHVCLIATETVSVISNTFLYQNIFRKTIDI